MPGGPAHLLFGFITGTGIHLLNSNFIPPYILIYGVSNFLGPDIGTWGDWFGENVTDMPRPVLILMEHLHSIEGYVFVFSFPLSYIYTRFIPWKSILPRHYRIPSIHDAWELTVAGGLSHFFLETLFEENGNTELYRLILSTGSFDSNEIPPLTIIVVGFVCVLVLYVFLTGWRRKNNPYEANVIMKNLLKLCIVYLLYCSVSKYILLRSPVGEEADLGVLLFLMFFHFLPVYLCLRCANRRCCHTTTTTTTTAAAAATHRIYNDDEESLIFSSVVEGSSCVTAPKTTEKEFRVLVGLNVMLLLLLVCSRST